MNIFPGFPGFYVLLRRYPLPTPGNVKGTFTFRLFTFPRKNGIMKNHSGKEAVV